MSNSFHNKFHRKNHNSYKNPAIADAGWDPIASVESPWQGDFVLSASSDTSVAGKTLSSNEASIYAKLNGANKICLNLSSDNIGMMGGVVSGDNAFAIGDYAKANSNSFVFAPISLSIPSSACTYEERAIIDTNGMYFRGSNDVFITSGTNGSERGIVLKTDNAFTKTQNDMRMVIETDSVSGNYIGIKDYNSPSWVGTTKIFNDGIHTDSLSVGTTGLYLEDSSITTDMVANSSITIPKLAFTIEQFLGIGATPIGTIIHSFRRNCPNGYLPADGTAYLSGDYPILYNYIGTGALDLLSAVSCSSVDFTEYNTITSSNNGNISLFGKCLSAGQFRTPCINNLYLKANGEGVMGEQLDLSSYTDPTSALTEGKIYSYICIANANDVTITQTYSPLGTVLYTTRTTAPFGFILAEGGTYSGASYPDFYNLLLSGELLTGTFTQWNSAYASNGGNVGFYGLDTGTSTFKMVSLTDAFIRSTKETSNIGVYQADELKSHTHYVDGANAAGSLPTVWTYEEKGASIAQVDANYVKYTGGTETRPKNISYKAMVQVYNQIEESEAIAQWNAKADTNLLNITTTSMSSLSGTGTVAYAPDVVTEYWTASGGGSWYRKYKSGRLEQGGLIITASTDPIPQTITFPHVFTNIKYTFLTTPIYNSYSYTYYLNEDTNSRTLSSVATTATMSRNWYVTGF